MKNSHKQAFNNKADKLVNSRLGPKKNESSRYWILKSWKIVCDQRSAKSVAKTKKEEKPVWWEKGENVFLWSVLVSVFPLVFFCISLGDSKQMVIWKGCKCCILWIEYFNKEKLCHHFLKKTIDFSLKTKISAFKIFGKCLKIKFLKTKKNFHFIIQHPSSDIFFRALSRVVATIENFFEKW